MEENIINQQSQEESTLSNIIFGTSSDDIRQGLENIQFIDTATRAGDNDKEQIVNEEDQNEIVNPEEETFKEEPASPPEAGDVKTVNETSLQQDENSSGTESENDPVNGTKISKAED